MESVLKWSAVETADQIRTGSVKVSEVVACHIARADMINGDLNVFTEMNADEAMNLARAMDDLPKQDQPPAFGVPMTTKSNADQIGFANSNGVPEFAGAICDQDSAVVANMKKGGGVIIGRTNTPEFSLRWCTSNPLHGVSLNPWNASVTPGGSSGGAASSVAMGAGCIAHGNDLGGSLRYPAYCCGVASIRPSMGRVPAVNPCAKAERPEAVMMMSVQGPIARTVADVRMGLNVMASEDNRDPMWKPWPAQPRTGGNHSKVGYCIDAFGHGVHESVANSVQHAVEALSNAGVTVVKLDPPNIKRIAELWGELLMSAMQGPSEEAIRQFGSEKINAVYDQYKAASRIHDEAGIVQLLAERTALQAEWESMFQSIDVLLMPTSGIPPFTNDLDVDSPEKVSDILNAQKFLFVVNALGLPSASLPTHVENGLPSGVQIVAPMHQDWLALDIAEIIERELGTITDQLWV